MPALRTLTVCTDLNPHRLWVHAGPDRYLVTSSASAAFLRRFAPDAHVLVVPAPVVVTPGDTCGEARVVDRRLVLLDAIAGHGRENLQHELEVGRAVVASADVDLLSRLVLRTLSAGGDPGPLDERRG